MATGSSTTHAKGVYRQADGSWRFAFPIKDDSGIKTSAEIVFTAKDYIATRLKEVLSILDTKKMKWPSLELTKNGDFDITWVVIREGSKAVALKTVELTPAAYQAIKLIISPESNDKSSYEDKVRFETELKNDVSSISYVPGKQSRELADEQHSKYNLQWEHLPGNKDWLVWGTAKVIDGDTIHLTVQGRGSALANFPAFNPSNDPEKAVKLRFAGVDTAETPKKDQLYGDEARNNLVAKKYNLPAVDINNKNGPVYQLALEGKKATTEITQLGGGIVVVDIDIEDGKPKVDGATRDKSPDVWRYMSMIYKPAYKGSVEDNLNQDHLYVNLNKTLIATASSFKWTDSSGRIRAIPLAAVSAPYQYSLNNTKFDTALWTQTTAVDGYISMSDIQAQEAKNAEEAKKATEAELAKLRRANDQTKREVKTYTVRGGETLTTIVKYYKSLGLDVSEESIAILNSLAKDLDGNYVLATGTVLNVPVITKIDANSGTEFKQQTVILDNTNDFFPAKSDRRMLESSYHVRIGDVQLVIPPLSIGINQTSSLEKVKTLRTKSSMITKVGSTQTVITMQFYFHDLEGINGYRVHTNANVEDYYMDGLRPLIAQFKKAPFLPIDNELLNETLGIHEVCLVNLSVATVPGFPHSLAATLTLVEFNPEVYMPQVEFLDNVINYPMFRWYYQQAMSAKAATNPYRTYLAPIEGKLKNDFKFQIAAEEQLIARVDAAKDLRFYSSPSMFDDQVTQGKNLFGRIKNDGIGAKQALQQYANYVELKKAMGSKFPKLLDPKSDVFKKIYGADFKLGINSSAFYPSEWSGELDSEMNPGRLGYFLINVEAETTMRDVPSRYKDTKYSGKYRFVESDRSYIEAMVKKGDEADIGIRAYKYNYQKLRDIAEGTEGEIQLEDYYIEDMWIVAMNVSYENSFSTFQTQTGAQPTYQYLGSQDPSLQLTLETDSRDAIASLQNLIKKADEYSRKYRYGITAGFIGFDNQMAALFGIKTVMIEQCSVHTVPGFPNRFQISLVLCGFDKTQKRTETLDGFAAATSTNMFDRYVTRDPSQQDAIIIERKMKDLELYPDLELPTYTELNEVLPYINAGFSIYHNGNAAKFVDPDFYVSTNWTYRSYFKQFMDQNNKDTGLGLMNLQDLAGVKGTTSVNSENYFDPDDASRATMSDMAAKTAAMVIPMTGGPLAQVETVPYKNPFGTYTPSTTSSQEELKKWAADPINIITPPPASILAKWATGDEFLADNARYKPSIAFTNPKPIDMYKEIYRWVDELWLKGGYVFDDRNQWDATKHITYGSVEDVAAAHYKYCKDIGDKRFIYAPEKPDGDDVRAKDFTKHTNGLITRERLANYIKALFHQESSGWKQFYKEGVPLVGGSTTDPSVGIGQVAVIWNSSSIEEAQRLTWDWRYNVEKAMQLMYKQWRKAWESDSPDVRSRPWDWMVRWYNAPAVHPGYLDRKDPAYNERGKYWVSEVMPKFEEWYNSEAKRTNTPNYPQNQDVLNYIRGMVGKPVEIAIGNKDELIAALKRVLDSPNKTDYMKININKDIRNVDLQKLSLQQLQVLYDKYGTLAETKETRGQYAKYQEMKTFMKANNLLNKDDPSALWRDQFTDLNEYDQRGRLLRGFPTFQMFIIDEGRWMASYKLWDNLYGFNAIQSIDVHKSRKIAADTAVVTMTNMYSNLTSRRIDQDYGDWSYNWWDNGVWGEPTQQLLNARKELVSSMMLQTGARIHLRMGYGSDATAMPVMFNGTITELDTSDTVTIVAQGDGLELSNIISADVNETNDGFWSKIIEPRDLLCKLLTSRGNWFKDVINDTSGGVLFKEHPLGIQHFGNPVKVPKPNSSLASVFGWYVDGADFGEAVQNIYSSNGEKTFSQYRYADGTEIEKKKPFSWTGFLTFDWIGGNGDEADVKMKLYGQTVWDVAQTLAYVSPDYIAAVHPFEMRSTLFFGKPYYKLAYRYDSNYAWDAEAKVWNRSVTTEYRKPFQQFHVFMSDSDIISNRIKASEEGLYTNVIAMVDGKPTAMQMADEDIRFDKQKTKIVDTNIVADWAHWNFWTSDRQGEYYARSELRDCMKDMYKGSLVTIGDPTVKPHDMCYMADTLHDMNGVFLVKDVTHSFSMQTGFITTISPDAVVVNDDQGTISSATWFASFGIGATSFFLGRKLAASSLRKLLGASKLINATNWTNKAAGNAMMRLAASFPHSKTDVDYIQFKKTLKNYTTAISKAERDFYLDKLEANLKNITSKLDGVNADKKLAKLGNVGRKGLVNLSKGIVSNLKSGKNALAFIRIAGIGAGVTSFGLSALAGLAFSILTETLSEKYRRMKEARQAVIIMPLKHQGRDFTAGINGVAGAVVGTKPGKMDQFYMGAGYGGAKNWTKAAGTALNWLTDSDPLDGGKDYEINTPEIAARMDREMHD